MEPTQPALDPARKATLEAFADTIVPGRKRAPDDHAIAGADTTPGAVEAGALDLLQWPAVGLSNVLDTLADVLNVHANGFGSEHKLELDPHLPAFVALSFSDRTTLVQRLTSPEHPEKEMWVGLALFSNMAYDSAAHLPTAQALADNHPGLTAMGYRMPDTDGLWRFPEYSYGRQLGRPHPNTTPSGSPA